MVSSHVGRERNRRDVQFAKRSQRLKPQISSLVGDHAIAFTTPPRLEEMSEMSDRYYLCSPSDTIGLPAVSTTWISVACRLLRLKEDRNGLLFIELLLTLALLYCPLDGTLIANSNS
jgi:hypothetical protein